jgi:hypothetical protein
MQRRSHYLGLMFSILLLGACGMGRTVLNVKAPSAPAVSAQPVPFKLVSVVDERHFEAHPKQANIPSLNDQDVGNPVLTARALGRKRGSFGAARGDLMLPPGASVDTLTRACLAAAVARAGGVLVDQHDARYSQATPLDVAIVGFWSWFRPGAWVIAVEFDAKLVLKAPLPGLSQGSPVVAHAEMRRPAMTDERWRSVVEDGLANLSQNLSQALTAAIASSKSTASSRAPTTL